MKIKFIDLLDIPKKIYFCQDINGKIYTISPSINKEKLHFYIRDFYNLDCDKVNCFIYDFDEKNKTEYGIQGLYARNGIENLAFEPKYSHLDKIEDFIKELNYKFKIIKEFARKAALNRI